MPAHAGPRTARSPERVELVDEDDRRRVFAACSNRSRTRAAPTPTNISTNSDPEIEKNGYLRLARHGAGDQRLAGTRRADEQHALGHVPAQPRIIHRVFQKIDDLLELVLGLIDARDIIEADLGIGLDVDLGLALADLHHPPRPCRRPSGAAGRSRCR